MSETSQPRRRRRRGLRIAAWAIPLLLVLGAGGYVAAVANAPLPEPEFTLVAGEASEVEADGAAAQATVDARPLPTAIGWLHGGDDEVWSNDDATYPLGSITKLIMMLVSMDHRPLEPGAEGDTYVWTAEDAARTEGYLAVDGVAYRIPVGAELTQRDMLKFIFLPSANDLAHTYALWTFGSNEAFLEAFEVWKAEHGLDSITLIEPTGMETDDRASAGDLVRVARLALENPTIAEFNAMQAAEMPWGVGWIENSNPLLGVMPGVIGTKTGTIYSSYNLIVSQEFWVEGRKTVNISVTLDRPSKHAREASGREVLNAMAELPQTFELVEEGEIIGTLTGVDGSSVDLITEGSASATLLPGESATRTANVTADGGTISIETPDGTIEVPLRMTGSLTEPDLWWRITNPGEFF